MTNWWAILLVTLWLVVIVLAIIVLGILRQVANLVQGESRTSSFNFNVADQGPRIDKPIPAFTAWDEAGRIFDDQALHGRSSLLLFISSSCGPCRDLARQIREADLARIDQQLIVVASENDNYKELAMPTQLRVIYQRGFEVLSALGISASPFAIAVDPRGIVRASGVPNTIEDLESLALTPSQV